MTPERWKQIELIFAQAIELPEAERAVFLQNSCVGDNELFSEVQSLLQQESDTGTLFETVISKAAGSLSEEELKTFEGRRIGPYRLMKLIGQGGMAEVYCAVRDDDQYQKQVAIKLIRKQAGQTFLVKRLRHERQILASLEHECIARFLEGGTTDDGIQYLVMEYIEGEPITTYCNKHKLNLRDRLQLFRSVCDAVQYAHRNLVIHRDLKPSNILVPANGIPKLLDFGIAKLLNPQRADSSTDPQTVTSVRIMTPEYASPEQIRGETVTTSTDVYSLGVMLYELLTGTRPHEFNTNSLVEIERIVNNQRPEKPSLAVSKNPSSDTTPLTTETRKKLSRRLAKDLDNIVMRAIQFEPKYRYLSAEHFGEDIDNYLQGRPVRARTPTLGYRATKFAHRHKIGVSVTATFIIFAVIFVTGILRERSRAEEARLEAEREAATAKAVSTFLQETLASANPFNLGRDVSLVEALQSASKEIGNSFKNEPETEAAVRNTVGFTFLRLGQFEDAEKHLIRALEIRQKLHKGDHVDVAESIDNLGTMYQEKGEMAKAEEKFREGLAMRRRVYGKDHGQIADSLNNLGVLLHNKGQIVEAEKLYREALQMRRKLVKPDHEKIATSLNNLAAVLIDKRELAEAETMLRQVVDLDRKKWGENHLNFAISMNNLAFVLENSGKLAEAEPIYRKCLEMVTRLLGDEHLLTTRAVNNLGRILLLRGNIVSAEPILRKNLEVQKRILSPEHPQIAISMSTLAQVLIKKNQCGEAEPLFHDAITIFAKSNYDPTPKAEAKYYLGECLTMMKRFPDAEKFLLESQSEMRALKGADSAEMKQTETRLNHLYDVWKKEP